MVATHSQPTGEPSRSAAESSGVPIVDAPVRRAERAIAEAREAARRAGVRLSDTDRTASSRRLAERSGRGLTSFAFRIDGLDNAVTASALERDLNTVEGIEAVVVYSTSTVWISAQDHIGPDAIRQHLERFGVTGYLTPSSLRRRSARLDLPDPRRRMRRHSDAHKRAAIEAERRKRGSTPLLLGSHRPSPFEGTEGLHTARELITPTKLLLAVLLGTPVLVLQLNSGWQFDYWQWVCLALATPVVFFCAAPFHRAMIGGARRGQSALDGASSIAIMAAYGFSVLSLLSTRAGDPTWRSVQVWLARGWLYRPHAEAIFLDVACGVTILLLFGRLLSRRTFLRSKSALSILQPPAAHMITVVRRGRKSTPVRKEVSTTEIRQGDDIIVEPGAVCPSDGEVISGKSEVDLGPVGGVNRTVLLTVGEPIFAGSTNHGDALKVRVRATGSRTRLASMYRWVHSAARDENHVMHLANRSASLLVPWAVVLGLSNFGMWWLVAGSLTAAVATTLSILVAVAPVALAVSAPLALRLGVGRAAAQGVLLRDTATIHRLAEVESIIFNRVGTLTNGPMKVTSVTPAAGEDCDLVLRVAAALCMDSKHTVSAAIVRADREARDAAGNAAEDGAGGLPAVLPVSNASISADGTFSGQVQLPGAVVGRPQRFGGTGPSGAAQPASASAPRKVRASVWRPRDMGELRDHRLADAALSGGSPVVVSWQGMDRGVITLTDSFKADASDAVDALEDMGIETHMMSRDPYPVARRIADSLGISTVLAGIAPNRKEATVRGVHAQGSRVAMVGDADILPALRVADVGILMGDLGRSGQRGLASPDGVDRVDADVVMIRRDVSSIPEVVNLVRHVRNTVDWNIWLSWAYNAIALLAAVSGVLNPLLATAAMLASSALIERRSARIISPHYVDRRMRHTHTWEGWWQRLRQDREKRRLKEMQPSGRP
ncbi:metal-transporting ATPase [Corynebacterium heidelbergense]|uniref:Metal-transporting ATPase n=1 Tax=Corynebacterium heidelbergense TaxID=2055947 RepID=A0A364V8H8_9CORY|nr:metal-transporting ATPase [Corynebacterium heidelbergense]